MKLQWSSTKNVVKTHLNIFGINLDNNIVGIITDDCA